MWNESLDPEEHDNLGPDQRVVVDHYLDEGGRVLRAANESRVTPPISAPIFRTAPGIARRLTRTTAALQRTFKSYAEWAGLPPLRRLQREDKLWRVSRFIRGAEFP
jgi:hypothetical protein